MTSTYTNNESANSGEEKLPNGRILKLLRTYRKMTLGEVSSISGVQVATISRMENNVIMGSLTSYMGIARALGLRLSELFAAMEQV